MRTILLFLPVLFLLPFATAEAQPITGIADPMRPGDARAGTFLIDGTDGQRAAPNVSTDVRIEVTGLIARTHVVQRFHNPTSDWVEGVYVFPLPPDSAVDRLRMRVGERMLEGQIQEREKARKTYQKAKSEGRKASLVEQERPNIFTTSVANLGPGEELEVAISYQEDVPYDQGRFALRFPMVVAPRYIPPAPLGENFGEAGWTTDSLPGKDADRITSPVTANDDPRSPTVSLSVRLDTGFRLDDVQSASHPVRVVARSGNVYDVELETAPVAADSDFQLEWSPVVGDKPTAALFHEEFEGESYALLMVVPPRPDAAVRARLSRETIFVIDTSGSMDGESIVQARAALDLALSQLRPEDSFNVIRFASDFTQLFPRSSKADVVAVERARQWVRSLRSGGGTEMLPALEAALHDDAERSAVRQVIFITDGAIGNEDALFRTLDQKLGRSRLFSVGIGSAPNSHFMTQAAERGRGTFTYISDPSQVEARMSELFSKIDNPILHDLRVTWDQAGVESWPAELPDLYVGEPIVLTARMKTRKGGVVLEGRRDQEDVRFDLPTTGGSPRSGIARLWARRKVKALMTAMNRGADRQRTTEAITTLGLRHHLVTRFTSLVAVDVTPTAPVDVELKTRKVPTRLPKGWTFRGLFGLSPTPPVAVPPADKPGPDLRTANRSRVSQPNAFAAPGRLPQGGTPAALLFWVGSTLLGASAVLGRAARAGRRT